MKLYKLFNRSKALLLNPVSEFKLIASEPQVVFSINKNFVIPLALLSSALSIIGSILSNRANAGNAYLFIAINTVIVFLLVLTHAYISGKTISMLGQKIKQEDNPADYYALSSYSQLPFFLVIALIKLFPSLFFLIFLGFYSGLLFYTGSGTLCKIQSEKRMQFTVLSVIIMITSFVVFSELYTILYSEIVEQFSTFAA